MGIAGRTVGFRMVTAVAMVAAAIGLLAAPAAATTQPDPPAASSPIGSIDAITRVPGGLRIVGWALDQDSSASIDVHVYDGDGTVQAGHGTVTHAEVQRDDIARAYPGFGPYHGFDVVIAGVEGANRVCAYGINIGPAGSNRRFACGDGTVKHDPFGRLDALRRVPGGVRAEGWSIDPDTSDPISVRVLGGNGAQTGGGPQAAGTASLNRPDIAAAYPPYGGGHGFGLLVPAKAGHHTMCGYATNAGAGSGEWALTCQGIDVSSDPIGRLETAKGVSRGAEITSWAIDPDVADPIAIRFVGGTGQPNAGNPTVTATADGERNDLGRPDYGTHHGLAGIVPLPPGKHHLCATALNVQDGSDVSIGCIDVNVPGAVTPVPPTRLVDTRGGNRLGADETLTVPVAGRAGVPNDAAAAVLTITATDPTGPTYLTVWPCGQPRPQASNVNLVAGQTLAAATVAGLGAGGAVCIYTQQPTHVIVDVAGWYPAGGDLNALTPVRLLDTRSNGGVRLTPGQVVQLPVGGGSGVPADAKAALLNITAPDPAIAGFVTAWPCGQPQPTASNLNTRPGQIAANLAMVGLGTGGKVCLFTSQAVHLVVDLQGWFGASAATTPIAPARLLDTRSGGAPRLMAGQTVELPVGGRAGIPADAGSAYLNVTATDAQLAGFVTAWPCGQTRPTASNVNIVPGQTIADLVVTGLGTGGKVCLYASQPMHLVVDATGWSPAS